MRTPSSSAAPFGFNRKRRVVIGKRPWARIAWVVVPLAALAFWLWISPTLYEFRCEARGDRAVCEIAEHYVHTRIDYQEVANAKHPARTIRDDSGSNTTYYMELGEIRVKTQMESKSEELATGVNQLVKAPPGTRWDEDYRPWSAWMGILVALGTVVISTWTGRSWIIALDAATDTVSVKRKSFFGPPKIIERLNLKDIVFVRVVTESSGDSTVHVVQFLLQQRRSVDTARLGSAENARAQVQKISELLGVRIGD